MDPIMDPNLHSAYYGPMQSSFSSSRLSHGLNGSATCQFEKSFGPISHCRYDFTLFFEQSILSLVPSAIFLLISAPKIYHLYNTHETKTLPSLMVPFKLILCMLYTSLQLALLVLWIRTPLSNSTASIGSGIVNLVAAMQLLILSHLSHRRSIRPLATIEIFLLSSILLDIPQARTLFLLETSNSITIARVFVSALAVRCALLLVEVQPKTSHLKEEYDISPEETSGAISRTFLWWMNSFFIKGARKDLCPEDFPKLDSRLAYEQWRGSIVEQWEKAVTMKRTHPLLTALWHTLKGQLPGIVFPKMCLSLLRFMQPLLISKALATVHRRDLQSVYDGYVVIGLTAIVYIGMAVSNLKGTHNGIRLMSKFRASLVSLIYNHSLLLEDIELDTTAAITLMSSDVDTLVTMVDLLQGEILMKPFELLVGLIWLTTRLGLVSIMPLLVLGACTLASSIPGKYMGPRAQAWAASTQARVGIVTGFLGDIKGFRMTGLTTKIVSQIDEARVTEANNQSRYFSMMIVMNFISNVPTIMAPALTFVAYGIVAYIRGSQFLDATDAFTNIALIVLVTDPASSLLNAVPYTLSGSANIKRIEEFLNQKTRADPRTFNSGHNSSAESASLNQVSEPDFNPGPEFAVKLDNATVRPSAASDPVIANASLTIKSGSIVAVTGAVGSGKTTLLRTILGELPLDSGTILMQAQERTAYCSQTPWLPNLTIAEVIRGPAEPKTNLIQDEWYNTVIEACALKQDLGALPDGDQTIVGSKGVTLSGGQKHRIALARALYARPKIVVLDDIFSALDRDTEAFILDRLFGQNGLIKQLGITVFMATHAPHHLPLADNIIFLSADDTSLKQVMYDEMKQQGLLQVIEQDAEKKAPDTKEETNTEPEPEQKKSSAVVESKPKNTAVFLYYLRHVNKWHLTLTVMCVLATAITQVLAAFTLKTWTENPESKNLFIFGPIYIILGLAFPIFLGGIVWGTMVKIGPTTGVGFHKLLLNIVTRAPMTFLSQIETGSLVSSFSNDIRAIETQLAMASMGTITCITMTIPEGVLVAVGSAYMAATIPFLLIAVYYVQHFYLLTTRQARKIDMEQKGPLTAQFLESLQGLVTIRAFGWSTESIALNAARFNDSLRISYTLLCGSRWLSLVLDLISAGISITVVSLAMNLRYSTSPALLGISLTNIMMFNVYLGSTIKSWAGLESALGAVARMQDFEATTPSEIKPGEDQTPPEAWPMNGKIEINHVTATYNKSVTALRDINIKIMPGQHIGVCGRTGSGKSTLVSVLLKLLDPSSGSIKIDSLDLSTLPREEVRRRITTIPQDPVFLPGSVRLNVDPFGICSDSQIANVLTKVGIWSTLESRGGLDAELKPDAMKLSKGQQQLLALSRALLQKSKVLILDEATSSVDLETEKVMRRLVAEEFQECSIISVAHRPDAILDSDVVMVLESGQVVEMGKPQDLIQQKGSKLKALVKG